MSEQDAIATGREGGLKSGRSRRMQGMFAAIDSVLGEMDDMTDEQRATLRRGLASRLREAQYWEPGKSVPGE